jgi:hypothetical protein
MSALMKIFSRRPPRALALAVVLAAVAAAPASASIAVRQVSADPFENNTSQHATELEPDTFASPGGTLISTFQTGRFFNGGASDIGVARYAAGSWSSTFLPGLTFSAGSTFGDPESPYQRVSDPSVAFDAKHGVWMISSIPLLPNLDVPTVFVSRSTTDDGVTWDNPVTIPAPAVAPGKVNLDKNWTVCDNHSDSDFYGNCYTEFDNFGQNDLEYMSTSHDGGLTWDTPVFPAGNVKGLGGQPLVQPDGTVIVPFESLRGKIMAFRSTDGGATWGDASTIDSVKSHANSGGLRTSPLPTAEIDGDGNVYVAWQDCRFSKSCSANDIVFSKSADGINWSDVAKIPIADVGDSQNDHFIPGLGVNEATAGSSADLALTYYFYTDASCTPATCVLQAATISSPDGGANWGGQDTIGPSMSLDQIAATSQGRMVGDYISTSFLPAGTYMTTVAIGHDPTGGLAFDEGMWAPTAPVTVATSNLTPSTTTGAHQFTGQGTGETHHLLREG